MNEIRKQASYILKSRGSINEENLDDFVMIGENLLMKIGNDNRFGNQDFREVCSKAIYVLLKKEILFRQKSDLLDSVNNSKFQDDIVRWACLDVSNVGHYFKINQTDIDEVLFFVQNRKMMDEETLGFLGLLEGIMACNMEFVKMRGYSKELEYYKNCLERLEEKLIEKQNDYQKLLTFSLENRSKGKHDYSKLGILLVMLGIHAVTFGNIKNVHYKLYPTTLKIVRTYDLQNGILEMNTMMERQENHLIVYEVEEALMKDGKYYQTRRQYFDRKYQGKGEDLLQYVDIDVHNLDRGSVYTDCLEPDSYDCLEANRQIFYVSQDYAKGILSDEGIFAIGYMMALMSFDLLMLWQKFVDFGDVKRILNFEKNDRKIENVKRECSEMISRIDKLREKIDILNNSLNKNKEVIQDNKNAIKKLKKQYHFK